ncbi:MAG: isoprenylcysteine carboxylmethyltransferase family protein [Anaerolineales bacterium]|jgi:protein-S-isoprenylcysteine O-methyltransferase Ste14
MVKAIIQSILGLAAFAAFWFGLAGRLGWWQGWILLIVFTLLVAGFAWRLASTDPGLLRERNRPGGDVPVWDRWIMRVYTLMLVVQLAVSALDSGRFRWSQVPWGVQLLGWCLIVGSAFAIWRVTASNPYLSSWARLQDDRDQVVVQDGPYAIIRHPMYSAIAGAFLGMPLALASWWSLVPAMVNIGLFVYRTHREDEMLKRGLPGYEAYAQSVRYKLIPGVW